LIDEVTLAAAKKRRLDRTNAFIHEMMSDKTDDTCLHVLQSRELGLSLLPGGPEHCIGSTELAPSTIVLVDRIQDTKTQQPLHILFDSGSDVTLIRRKAIPQGIALTLLDDKRQVNGVMGSGIIKHKVLLYDLMLPEIHPTMRVVKPIECLVLDELEHCDMLVGRDVMAAIGIDILFSSKEIKWMEYTLPFRPATALSSQNNLYGAVLEAYLHDDIMPKSIESAKYEAHNTDQIAEAQIHLTKTQRRDLAELLRSFPTLFDGELRTYPNVKMHLDLIPGSTPRHLAPYPVANSSMKAFKDELERLVRIGVLERCGLTEWASPTFIIPKKDGTVRWVSDFRELNKCIKQRIYPLPKIQDILKKRHGYAYFTKLDLSMAYYTYELDEASKNLCVINTPFGKYRYTRLPMGIKQSPDVAQAILENLLRDIEECDVYIDDIGCFDKSWKQHLATLYKVLTILRDNNFAVNPRKVEWARQETDWLGYWLTPIGLKPWKKKVDAILKLERPQTLKQLRAFIGAVTYYRDMFQKRSHILTPLTDLTKCTSKKIPWGPPQEKAFKEMKAVMARDVLLRYPDHNQPFHVYTDASDYQLGSIIVQNKAPVAYYSRKLTSAQRNYTTMEKELLSIVETLREYRTMLFGCKELHIYTDHRNLTFTKLNSQRVIRWRLYLEEFNPIFHYIKGEDYNIADALSRIPRDDNETEGKQQAKTPGEAYESAVGNAHNDALKTTNGQAKTTGVKTRKQSTTNHTFSILADDVHMANCFVNFPENFPPVSADKPYPLSFLHLAEKQAQDQELTRLANTDPRYHRMAIDEATDRHKLIVYTPAEGSPWKICIPTSMLETVVKWYHRVLVHPGEERMLQAIGLHFYHARLRTRIAEYVRSCEVCQHMKISSKKYGELPPREAQLAPWENVAVDLIGPWTITIRTREVTFRALTIIDMVTNFPEVVRLESTDSRHVAMQFRNVWLCRYPKPMTCTYDQGTEFTGWAFQAMLRQFHIKGKPATAKNPQGNSIVERLHQTMGNAIRTMLEPRSRVNTEAEATMLVDTILQLAAYAARAAIHTTMRVTPGSLAFQRDMILNIPLIADFKLLQARRQAAINMQLMRANKSRTPHDYQPGDKILVLVFAPNKLQERAKGPYTLEKVHTNGTVTYFKTPNITERINIRRIKPFIERNPTSA
jgi:transposase InsO family protein